MKTAGTQPGQASITSSPLHKPAMVIFKQIDRLATDPAGIAHTAAADLERSSRPNIEHTIDRVTPSVFPDNRFWLKMPLFIKFCQHTDMDFSRHFNHL